MPWNSNHIMTLPISMDDIASAVNYNSQDLGTLITNGTINKWAKFKPVRQPDVDYSAQMTDDRSKWRSTSDWWQANDGHCGLSIQEFDFLGSVSTYNTFLYKLKMGNLPWDYVRLNGGTNWFRAFDFFRYYSDAQVPFGDIGATTYILSQQNSLDINWETNAQDENELSLLDIKLNNVAINNNYYLGVLLWKSNGTQYYLTSTTKISGGGSLTVHVDDAQALIGDWNCVPFISDRQYTITTQTAQSGVYASCFGITSIPITIQGGSTGNLTFFLYGMWNSEHNAVDYELEITISSGQSTVTNLTVNVVWSTDYAHAETTWIAHVNLGTVTIGVNTPYTHNGTISFSWVDPPAYDPGLFYWIHAYADDTPNVEGYEAIEEGDDLIEDF